MAEIQEHQVMVQIVADLGTTILGVPTEAEVVAGSTMVTSMVRKSQHPNFNKEFKER